MDDLLHGILTRCCLGRQSFKHSCWNEKIRKEKEKEEKLKEPMNCFSIVYIFSLPISRNTKSLPAPGAQGIYVRTQPFTLRSFHHFFVLQKDSLTV